MASIISAGTSTGTALNLTGDTSGVLSLASNNGTVAMTIDTSQNVGIGTTSPVAKLSIQQAANTITNGLLITNAAGSSNGGWYHNGTALTGREGGVDCINLAAGKVGIGVIPTFGTFQVGALGDFYVDTTSTAAFVQVGRSSGTSADNTNFRVYNRVGANAFTVNSGNKTAQVGLVLSVGDATPSTTGAGITFPATQNASSDANTLDDYEEGSFTPTLGGSGNTYTATYTGNYTKVGNVVTVMVSVNWTAKSGTSGVTIALPFTPAGQRGGMAFGMVTNSTIISASQILYAQLDGGVNTINLRYSNNGGSWTGFTPANMGTSGEFQISGTYIV